jgi:hypothetical protein
MVGQILKYGRFSILESVKMERNKGINYHSVFGYTTNPNA